MKRLRLVVLAFAVACFFSLPALAQHGAGGGAGGGMGQGGGMGAGQGMGRPAGAEPGSMGSHGQPGAEGTSMGHRTQMGMNGSGLSKSSPTNLLSQDTKLSSKLQSLLPSGSNVQDAANGFKNLGEFVAAVHVAHNLGIPFDQLKTAMLSNGDNLGKAIHTLNPNISKKQAKGDAKKGEKQASQDIKAANNS
jgi:hypothetical protein